MKSIITFLILSCTFVYATTLRVAVAANMSGAIYDIREEFHKLHPNVKVDVIVGSSGKLTSQIKYGAPYDVFLSANSKYPNDLYKENIAKLKPYTYAYGKLIMFSKNEKSFSMNFHKLTIANPKTAPYGLAATQYLKNSNLYDNVKSRLVYGESVSQTVSYATKITDFGILSKSSIYSQSMKKYLDGNYWTDIDESLYSPIAQAMVLLNLKNSSKNFYEFLQSKVVKGILVKYGYGVK